MQTISRRNFIIYALAWGSGLLRPFKLSVAAEGTAVHEPAYQKLAAAGELNRRAKQAREILADCRLCPRQCGVNRQKGELGFCRAPAEVVVYSSHPHFGEERSLVGTGGSGTIFFSNCNLRCVFCQNWPIAHEGHGQAVSDRSLAEMMLRLQKIGCHNINLVTPTHVMPNILNAVSIACGQGLRLPLVYNTSGYERLEMLKILDGVVDIYLPDLKYMDADKAARYSAGADDYPISARQAILEMHRQVGLHRVDRRGVAQGGLMIRHLVMPNGVAGTHAFVRWVADNLPRGTYVNIMHQYHVDYKAFDYPEIWRAITADEFLEAMDWADKYGLTHLDPHSLKARKFFETEVKGR
jgi:putative pyruvate formate lyase activating enzyme